MASVGRPRVSVQIPQPSRARLGGHYIDDMKGLVSDSYPLALRRQ